LSSKHTKTHLLFFSYAHHGVLAPKIWDRL